MIAKAARKASAFDTSLLTRAVGDAFLKLDPRKLARNPVIFVTEIVTVLVTFIAIRDAFTGGAVWFSGQIAVWLWFTVLFATFAEAVAEGRGKAQADALRRTRKQATAKRLSDAKNRKRFDSVGASELKVGDLVVVEAGELIPSDGEIIEGVASVNESAITGESAGTARPLPAARKCCPTGSSCA